MKCDVGQNSSAASAECLYCAEGYYRQHTNSPAADCRPCSAVRGVSCGIDTTLATLQLAYAHWRHANATTQTWHCKVEGSWSPCQGGAFSGAEGDGYCAEGYRGPRCELCEGLAYSRYFDQLDARCRDCGDLTVRTAPALAVAIILIATYFFINTEAHRSTGSTVSAKLFRAVLGAQAIWRGAGMRYKAKVLVGLYQCLSAVPSAFNVLPPQGLEEYSRWMDLIEVPSELENIFVPAACLGNYRTRIFLGSLWPVGLVGLVSIASVAWELLQHHRQADGHTARSVRTVCAIGLQRVLPLTLGLTFLVVPSTSMRIFRSFHCETFEYDQETSRRYLYADLTLSCDSDEYEATQSTAFAMLALWPVGIPVLYAALLWASRDALRTGVPTSLSRATAFLSGDYDAANFWWEPLEMCRKLTLTGWVLLIRGEAEQARVITALFVSIGFFGLNLRFRPLKESAPRILKQSGVISNGAACGVSVLTVCVSLPPFHHLQSRQRIADDIVAPGPHPRVHVRPGDQDLRAVPRCLPQLWVWRFCKRLLPVFHLLRLLHAPFSANHRSLRHCLPDPHAEQAAPASPSWRALCRVAIVDKRGLPAPSRARIVTILPPVPLA